MNREVCVLAVGLILVSFVPAASASGPLICNGEIDTSCGWNQEPCDLIGEGGSVKDLCGIDWFGCQMTWRDCILDPVKSCGWGGDSCILDRPGDP